MKFRIVLFFIFIQVKAKYVLWPSSSTANSLAGGATVAIAPLHAPTVSPSPSSATVVQDSNDCTISAPGVVESGGCSNGGRCMQGDTKRYCLCKDGWEGLTCEQPVTATTAATTLASFDSSEISATTRYNEKHICQPGGKHCKNGGQCKVDISNANPNKCVCTVGWDGPLCEIDDPRFPHQSAYPPDVCSPFKRCLNGGTCDSFLSPQKICRCLLPFSGKYCEKVHQCIDDEKCQNRGKCIYSAAREINGCACALQYTGIHCELSSATFTVDLPIAATAKVAVCKLLQNVPALKPLSDALQKAFEGCSFTVNPSIKVTFVQQSNL